MSIWKTLHMLVSVLFLSFGYSANAEQHNKPLLTISKDGVVKKVFDFKSLSTMNSTKFETSTIWTDGIQTFEGVPLKVLLNELEFTQGMVLAVAVNDYAVEIPTSQISSLAPIIAYNHNGERMSLRNKGPLWLVYPYDSDTSFQTEVTYSRSIWQLNRIELK